jgi:hypothetical protein
MPRLRRIDSGTAVPSAELQVSRTTSTSSIENAMGWTSAVGTLCRVRATSRNQPGVVV